ncbi:MAG: bifunctional riboflavin kinase/FAD synthetase [bacterium]
MLIFKDAKPNLLESSAVALGFFDGVHLGHSFVIKSMIKKAKKTALTPCAVTFANHPLEILQNTKVPSIITLEKRLELLQNLGIEAILLLDFSKELIALSAENYLKNILVESLHPKFITVGFNHSFGANKKGNSEFLQNNSKKYGYELLSIPPVELNSTVISSSLIKKCIANSDFESASQYLGRDFSIVGEVVKGRQLGRTLGFATANLLQDENLVEIPNGVYSGWAKVHGKKHKAMINVGTAPTLKDGQKTIEAHILNFDKDIYSQIIEVGFNRKIRDEKKFDSKEELVAQIKNDCGKV